MPDRVKLTEIDERLADLYAKQAAFYEARADQAHHTAVAAAYFRREASRIRTGRALLASSGTTGERS